MADIHQPFYYVRDQVASYGPYSWHFLTTTPLPATITHIWYPGLGDWLPITRVFQAGPVTIQTTGVPLDVTPPNNVRFAGRLWPSHN